MIRLFWKFRYFNLLFIFSCFFLCILNLKDFKVYFESERIIELADVDKDIIDKSLDDRNITLVGLSFSDSLTYSDMLLFEKHVSTLSRSKDIRSIRSIFNESYFFNTSFIPIELKLIDTENITKYSKSLNNVLRHSSNHITKDFKNLFFLIKSYDFEDQEAEKLFISSLNQKFTIFKAKKINITGQMKSELYMQDNVYKEAIFFTLASFILCSVILWVFFKNIKLVIINLVTVIFSILFSFSISNYLFGGIELVMIIIPAVIFIITISDYMHLKNIYRKYKKKYRLFYSQISIVGKPVFLTSFTTAIGFLSFTFCSFEPLTRFGIITTLSIFITLFIIITFFAVAIDYNLIKTNKEDKRINYLINFLKKSKNYKEFLFVVFLFLSILGIYTFNINNFLTDELNKKSNLYQEINYFDNYFGGIKPVSFNSIITNAAQLDSLNDEIIQNDLHVDLITKRQNISTISSRMKDFGSDNAFIIYNQINSFSKKNNIDLNIGGVGYLFDSISNRLTREVLIGLFFAVFAIGILFVLINNFKLNYFFVSLLPNIIPMTTALGVLYFTGFYFSLSNAFIFAIVFGLIVDDSIHIISSYAMCRRRKYSIKKSIDYCKTKTFSAIVKTTIVIVVTLFPLLFSEFKSISQLAFITIISALIAIIFDIVFLPLLLKKYIK